MPLNLVSDPWIPVRLTDGARRIIAPWQMADPAIAFPDWPRPDLNVACLELLIGLVALADPPAHDEEWEDRQAPDPARLRDRLAAFAPAFDLLGDGPRFLQDREALQGEPNPPDMLFIDSASANATKENKDLVVKRGRYTVLSFPLAAMALYALQATAPGVGAGNRACMRGGGPLVTLVDPGQGLWPLIWANVPDGQSATPDVLPWMKRTPTSENEQQRFPEQAHPAEAFFGMPKRLRLVAEEDGVVGVIQRPHGISYSGWLHPLSPHRRKNAGDAWRCLQAEAGLFGYRNWLGVTVALPRGDESLTRRAAMVREWHRRGSGVRAHLIVAGWAMDPKLVAKPRDFTFSTPPLLALDAAAADRLAGMIEAANEIALALRAALIPVLAEGEAREAMGEAFYQETQADFEGHAARLTAVNADEVAAAWLADMARVARALFEGAALEGLADRDPRAQAAVVAEHRRLNANLAGQGGYGGRAFDYLGLPRPAKTKEMA